MPKRQANGGGQPWKGQRRLMAARFPIPVAERVERLAEDLDLSYNDTLLMLVEIAFRDGTLPEVVQEELPTSA